MTARPEQFLFLASRLRDRAHSFIIAELKRLGFSGLEPSHGAILSRLYLEGPLNMSRLAELVDKTKPTVTVLVNKLEKQGLVERTPDPSDGRASLVRLTPASLAYKADMLDISNRLREKAFKDISVKDQLVLAELLERVVENL